MKRTTAGVNYLRLHHRRPATATTAKAQTCAGHNGSGNKTDTSDNRPILYAGGSASPLTSDYDFANAALTKEFSIDNLMFRESNAVNVMVFNVLVGERLCKMRSDTLLVLVGISGISEAGADGTYRTYVRDHWDEFYYVMVTTDGQHSLNTEEQVNLLEFVCDTNKDMKNIRVIIVCNKVKDLEDPEQEELMKEPGKKLTGSSV
jgi:hypothetical protein